MEKNKNMLIGIIVILIAVLFTGFAINNMKSQNVSQENTESNTSNDNQKAPAKPIEQRVREELEDRKLIITFKSTNEQYNQSGTATFEESEEGMIVLVEMNNLNTENQMVKINNGMCPEIEDIAYDLNPIVDGKSETIITTSLEQLTMQYPMSVNVEMTEGDNAESIACGYITIN